MSSANSLRPAWHRGNPSGGKGFQPPPTVASERSRSQSFGSSGGGGPNAGPEARRDSNLNAFAALDDDEDVVLATSTATSAIGAGDVVSGGSSAQSTEDSGKPRSNSRSEALRAATRSMSTGSKAPGRSLADLAARAPEPNHTRSVSTGVVGGGGGGGGRFSHLRTTDSFDSGKAENAKVVRYTRERLLSMRPASSSTIPVSLKEFVGSVIVSEVAQDPVCWDSFDAEEIWAAVPRRASTVKVAGEGVEPRRSSVRSSNTGGGRWQRGVALPPPDQTKKGRDKDADSPNELWDDPKSSAAASDFSAFGSMPSDDGDATFDFEKMAEQTRKLDEEMHGSYRSRTSSDAESTDLSPPQSVKVDPKRPLATIGTTIQSGSGDEVNVFEDFGEPGVEEEDPAKSAKKDGDSPAIRGAGEDPSASSRLMAMIGVNRDESVGLGLGEPGAPIVATEPPSVSDTGPVPGVGVSPWGETAARSTSLEGTSLSMNPWGASLLPATGDIPGLSIQAQMRGAVELEEQKRQADLEIRRRQEQEEAQRRLALQREEEERARQVALQQQQQQQLGVQSQVELVLLERISTFLENSWGRSDLISILTTLHSEDSRVIPLLSTVDALRALLVRHPRRIAIRQDPSVGAELAILVMTNAQWQQQQQQQEAQARAQIEELRLREQRRQLEEQQRAAQAAAVQQAQAHPPVSPNAPWYYSDPQNNIQGPFRANEMRQWLEAGYFKGDLPISQQPNGPFRALSSIFPDLLTAFMIQDTTAADAAREAEEKERLEAERLRLEAEARAKHEAAERERKAMEAAARAERERRLAEEAEREMRQAEKTEAGKNANGGNESSAQLKMMLGLSSQGAAAASSPPEKHEAVAPKQKAKVATKSATTQQRANSTASAGAPEVAKAPASVATPTPSPWGGAAQAVQRKSMSEIQKEEARAAAMKATQQEGTRSSGGGWANVAAARGGSSAWAGGAAKATPAAVVASASISTTTGVSSKPHQVSASSTANSSIPQRSADKNATASAAEDFGAKMSPAMEKWCKEQMMKLNNGSDDLTLVSFCMTLNDPAEIRQYLTAYLGSHATVNNFATEFINKRGLGSGAKQTDWETTVTAKKTRKGKKK